MDENISKSTLCCPHCGGRRLQITTETDVHTSGKNYSGSKGCLGALMFGPLGLLCGSCGQGQKTTTTNTTYWLCPDCGHKFRRPEDIREQLDDLKKRRTPVYIAIILILCAFFIIPGIVLDVSFAKWFGIIIMVINILLIVMAKTVSIPKLQKELDEIEDGMKKFMQQ